MSERDRLMQLILPYDEETYFDFYISKTYYKTASMISLGCRGLAVMMDFKDLEA